MSNIIYPKKKPKVFLDKKRLSKAKQKVLNNPGITHFNSDSFFIYDIDEGQKYLNNTNNPNSLKLSKNELETFLNIINSIEREKLTEDKLISVHKNIIDKLNEFFKINIKYDALTSFIIKKFEMPGNTFNITCRKLSNEYFDETGIKVSKSTINNIIKNNLGFRYIKTAFKNFKILSNENIITSLCFIKIIERCLKLNFKIIYIDESSILTFNNKGMAWRKQNQEVYVNFPKKTKNKPYNGCNR